MAGNAAKNARITKFAILSFFLIWFAVSLFTYNVHAEVLPYTMERECNALAKTDVLEGAYKADGTEYTLQDYINGVNDGSLYADYELHTELLYKIIPERLLNDTCSYYYKGKAYSFYVKTFSYTKEYPYASEVFIILNTITLNADIGSEATFKLTTFTHGYFSRRSPVTGKHVSYCKSFETSDYYLRDFQFYAGVKNKDLPNYGDANYSKSNDNGAVLYQIRINFKGAKDYKKSDPYESLKKLAVDTILTHWPKPSEISKIYKGLKTVKEWAKAFKDCFATPTVPYDEINNEVNIKSFPDRYLQEHNDKPYFVKFSTASPVSDYKPLINDKGHMNCIVRLSNGYPPAILTIGAFYNIFVHQASGNNYIITPSGTTKTYTNECSNTAQFICQQELEIDSSTLI